MNKVVLIGRWTKDTDLKMTQGGNAVLNGVLAVDRRFKQEGEQTADFIPIVAWRKIAENTANYCGAKGNQVAVSGRIQTRSYDDKEGIKRYVTEVVADEIQFLDKIGSNTNRSFNQGNGNSNSDDDIIPVDDEDIPF